MKTKSYVIVDGEVLGFDGDRRSLNELVELGALSFKGIDPYDNCPLYVATEMTTRCKHCGGLAPAGKDEAFCRSCPEFTR